MISHELMVAVAMQNAGAVLSTEKDMAPFIPCVIDILASNITLPHCEAIHIFDYYRLPQ